MPTSKLFRSYWIGGYESATHINVPGERLDLIAGTQHDVRVQEDYGLLSTVGIRTARDAVRWHLVDRGAGQYDFSSFDPMLKAAQAEGIQVIWDLCHYGLPEGLDLLSPAFVDRFARFAGAVAQRVRDHSDETPFYSPVNEINFFSWAASRNFMFPFLHGKDHLIKDQLVRAAIAAVEAIWSVDPRARLTYPEPAIHVVAPRYRPDLAHQAYRYSESQFDAWSMLAGYIRPELGGHPKYLDIIGVNFYHSNQWEVEDGRRLGWNGKPIDERWLPFRELLVNIWERYGRPLYVAETSHFGEGRGRWILEVAGEVGAAIRRGVPVEGICLYPIIDRYDWQDKNHWHRSGLWDFPYAAAGNLERVLNLEYANALRESESLIP